MFATFHFVTVATREMENQPYPIRHFVTFLEPENNARVGMIVPFYQTEKGGLVKGK